MTFADVTLQGGTMALALILAQTLRDLVVSRRNGRSASHPTAPPTPTAPIPDACEPCRVRVDETHEAVGILRTEATTQTRLLTNIDKNISILKDRSDRMPLATGHVPGSVL